MIDVQKELWKSAQKNTRSQKYLMEGKRDPIDDVEILLSYSSFLSEKDLEWLNKFEEYGLKFPKKPYSEKQLEVLEQIKKRYT